ncbi:MAG: UTP--glucose-1-phosphate uridylyltransferase [Beutenbergiaceae bacterium]
MRQAGVNPIAIDVFGHYYDQLVAGATGLIPEDSIEPLTDVAHLTDLSDPPASDATRDRARALERTAIIKLNGGLGTSMGMDRAKSLLPVRDGLTFLDIIVTQVQAARQATGARLPLIFMNSFRTATDTQAALARYPDLPVPGIALDFLQSMEPKLEASTLAPVDWPADPELEWCPPGHGDLYPSLLQSGVLDGLIEHGYRYAFVSNADNLGASPSAAIADWFAASGAPYAAEVCRRTSNDRKGGHLAIRKSDRQLILRDTAQTAPRDMHHFTDEQRHRYFHTNNLWFDLVALRSVLQQRHGVLGLPLIRNIKTADPTDPTSPQVVQIESAMGTAVEVFAGAQAIAVGRDRFLPVKTTNELLLLRSDVYHLGQDGTLEQAGPIPRVDLDHHYRRIEDFERLFPAGPPSLRQATSLQVAGKWRFGADVTIQGEVSLAGSEGGQEIPAGAVLTG